MISGAYERFQSMNIEQSVKGYDLTTIQGSLYYTQKYFGCPYCETKNFVLCNKMIQKFMLEWRILTCVSVVWK